MKKRNIFIGFIFSLLMCFSLNFFSAKTPQSAHAESEVTITFDAVLGTCDTKSITIQSGETLPTIPTPRYAGYLFLYWQIGSEEVSESTTFTEDTTLTAKYIEKLNIYTISKPGSNYLTSAKTRGGDDYNLAQTTSLQNAISLISEDSADALNTNTPTINFDNIELTENLNLSFNNLELSGTIIQNEFLIILTSTANSSKLNLVNLDLRATSTQDLITINGNYSSTILVSNSSFNSSESAENYAIKLNTHMHQLVFQNKLSYSTKYLYNHSSSSQPSTQLASSFKLITPAAISITIPYSVDKQFILTSNAGKSIQFDIHPTQSNYTCSSSFIGYDLVAKTYFDIIFDPNGGTIEIPYDSNNISFKPSSDLIFPSENNFAMNHFYISGFVAKISYDSKVWYFDKASLEALINADTDKSYLNGSWDISNIPTYFTESKPVSNVSGFEYYRFDSSSTNLNYLAVKFMLDLGQTPEFVTIWEDVLYPISFDSNGGNSIETIEDIFGTTITISQTPSKEGYIFMGWFDSLEKANNYSSHTAVTQVEITDAPQTLYAAWKVETFNLTIDPKNGTNPLSLTVDYGSSLKDILDANANSFIFDGYEFIGWFNEHDQTLEIDENTIITENLSIIAKWEIKSYTITLIINHPTDLESIFDDITLEFNSDLGTFFDSEPSINGFKFEYWCKKPNGQEPIIKANLPTKMPSENLTLYARWTKLQYHLILHYDAVHQTKDEYVFFGDNLPITTPEFSGYIFNGWFEDSSFETPLSFSTMPSDPSGNGIHIYAKFTEKKTVSISANEQTYELSNSNKFEFSSTLNGFIVEYFVDDNWTTVVPTKKGIYDVRVIRAEDSEYKLFVKTFEKAFTITANSVDLSAYILILYAFAGLELICALIILFIRKQRRTYLTYSIALPFGLVSNTQFINLVISATLALFGFVLIIAQTVKLKKLNNEIAKISIENKEYVPPDVSENDSISKKVEELLNNEGLIDKSLNKKSKKVEIGFYDDPDDEETPDNNQINSDEDLSNESLNDEKLFEDEDINKDE